MTMLLRSAGLIPLKFMKSTSRSPLAPRTAFLREGLGRI